MKELFGVLSLIVGFVPYAPYLYEIAKGTAKPHIFSWLTWTLLTGLGFVISYQQGGGEGSWIFALQALMCFVVAICALKRGEKNITMLDKYTFGGALLAMVVYVFTKNAIISALLAASIDCLGFVPTFRKSYMKPLEEPTVTYAIAGFSYVFALAALAEYNFSTMFYAIVLTASNFIFVTFLLIRRRSLKVTRPS